MSWSAAYYMLLLESLASITSVSRPRTHLFRFTKHPAAGAPGSSSSPAMASRKDSSNFTSNSDGWSDNARHQGDKPFNLRTAWRPYRGRWDSKGVSRGNSGFDTALTDDHIPPDKQSSRRGRARQNQRNLDRRFNTGAKHPSVESERSLSPRKTFPPPSQSHRSQNETNSISAHNPVPTCPMMNPTSTFPGFPVAADPLVSSALQPPFFMQNMANQPQQFQPPQQLDQSLMNPLLFPLLAGNLMPGMPGMPGMPPVFPQTAFVNFSLPNQGAPDPMMLNALSQMAANNQLNFSGGPIPLASEQTLSGPGLPNRQKPSKPPERPSASGKYLHQSSLLPKLLSCSQPLLIILDLNGTLIYRKTRRLPPSFARRAGLDQFLDTLMEKYKVMIWSSSQPPTVDAVCQRLFTESKRKELVAEWGRDKFGLTNSQYKSKIQVYKTLETVWSSKEVQASYPKPQPSSICTPHTAENTGTHSPPKSRWDQTNTILIDDSKLKALSEPYNLIEIPEFTNTPGIIDESTIFPRVLQRLEILAKCDDVSQMLQLWNTKSTGTSILDLDITTFSNLKTPSSPQTDPAHARKERRKARKLEKKAMRRAAATATPLKAPPPPQAQDKSPSISPPFTPASNNPHYSPKDNGERSPSPASSAQSENFLLDRLEESLDV